MTLPAPHLDDRRFQDLVDDAKRHVQQACPEWTDHNVSDPGVTLIETFAFMVDQLLYRLNRVPDRLYVKFLELIGVRLFPPTAARVPVTFWLSAAREGVVEVPAGTQVATARVPAPGGEPGGAGGADEPVVFTTVERRPIVACRLAAVATRAAGADAVDRGGELRDGGFPAFAPVPAPGDTLLVGLSDPVPACAVAVRLSCRIEGVGVDPDDPPVAWEAWTGAGWEACEVDRDETGGLNRAGDVVVHVPGGHAASVIGTRRAGWLRARVVTPAPGQPFYRASPRIDRLEAVTLGGTAEAVHAEVVDDETLGLSEGVPGQRFALVRRPVVPAGEPVVLEVGAGGRWQAWTCVDSFAGSGEGDHHFVLDAVAGEVRLGPAVRRADGTLARHGAVPPAGAPLRIRRYRAGGGERGNVARGVLTVLKTPIPFVTAVTNRRAAWGGVDAESMASARERGPLQLRTRDRAVTVEDHEHLAREAAPEVARVRAVAADGTGEPGVVRVLLVPAVGRGAPPAHAGGAAPRWAGTGPPAFEDLRPAPATLRRVAERLDERRCVGARIVVEPPVYQGVTVVARLRAHLDADTGRLAVEARAALDGYLDPLHGGPAGTGWPFGRPLHVGEVYGVLQRVGGVDHVEEARLFPADPVTGERSAATDRIVLSRHALLFSYDHQILVEP